MKPKVSYEAEADVLRWEISKDKIDYATEVGNLVVHYSKKHVPVYIEVLEASKLFIKVKMPVVRATNRVAVLA